MTVKCHRLYSISPFEVLFLIFLLLKNGEKTLMDNKGTVMGLVAESTYAPEGSCAIFVL